MPVTTYSEGEYKALASENKRLRAQVEELEAKRPQWALGYTSDSVAAQCSSAALQNVWNVLRVNNQSQCMEALRKLVEYAHP